MTAFNPSSVPTSVRGADLLCEALIAVGIDTLFGVPGDTGLILYDALFSRRDRLHHILARDERHAATMADTYARVTNRIGVVEVSSGGGSTYAVGGLGEAMASGIPVLVLTSDIHSESRDTGALTEIDHLVLFAAVTKWRQRIVRAGDIPAAVQAAVAAASDGRPGPVLLVLPEDVLDEKVCLTPPLDLTAATVGPARRPRADPSAVTRAAEVLSAADRPVIIAGSGVHTSMAWQQLARLAEHAGLPVATTIHGKGSLPDSHPLALGVVGNNGARDYANDYVRSADAVLFIGTRANATDTNAWTGPPRSGVAVAQIDIEPGRAGRNFTDAIPLAGDAATVIDQLRTALPAVDPALLSARVGGLAARRSVWSASWPTSSDGTLITPANAAPDQLLPARVVAILNEVLGDDTIVIADPGTPTPNVASFWQVSTAARTVIAPRGHGPMGYAIPGAIGAAIALPGRPVLAVTADGSFAMSCGELETAVRYRLPILFVQMTNHSLGWIKMLQHLYTGRRYFGVDPGDIDAVQVARACGMAAERVTTDDRLRALAADFLARLHDLPGDSVAAPGPLYLDVEVPLPMDVTPPVASWIDSLAGDAPRPVY